DRDVDVQAERVVAPDDIPEDLVVPAVVRGVDDALLLPRAPRVRAGRGETDPDRVRELEQLGAPLPQPRRSLVEGVATAGADLDLGGDQLADEVVLERGALGRRLELLEAVREVESLGFEDRELLLDGKGEILRGLELLAREGNLLLRAEALGGSHGRTTLEGGSRGA